MNLKEELQDVQPFPEVESVISEILENNVFTEGRCNAYFRVSPTGRREEDLLPEDRSPFRSPSIWVEFWSRSRFRVSINFERRPWGDLLASRMNCSKFVDAFRPDKYLGWYNPQTELETDPDTLARFVSYHMRLFDYESASHFKIERSYDLTSGNSSPIVSDKIRVPIALKKALEIYRQLEVSGKNIVFLEVYSSNPSGSSDCMVLQIDMEDGKLIMFSDWIVSPEEVERMRQYRNFDSILYSLMINGKIMEFLWFNDSETDLRFLTDMFCFCNPGVEADQVCVNLNFECFMQTDDDEAIDEDLSIRIYPDGTTSSTEKVRKVLEDYRRAEEEDAENCEPDFDEDDRDRESNGPSCNLPGFKQSIDTIPSQIVVNYLEHTFGSSKVKVYDNDRLCMTFDACYPNNLYRTNGEVFILSFYFTPEQEEIFNRVKLNEEINTFRMDNGDKIVSLNLSDNLNVAAASITYYMKSLGYDPERLRYEFKLIEYE